ncbi:MAG TPA: hypothetical protein VIK35_10175 [Verrucomicrobiae bacterium]
MSSAWCACIACGIAGKFIGEIKSHHFGATHVRLQLAAQDMPCEALEL